MSSGWFSHSWSHRDHDQYSHRDSYAYDSNWSYDASANSWQHQPEHHESRKRAASAHYETPKKPRTQDHHKDKDEAKRREYLMASPTGQQPGGSGHVNLTGLPNSFAPDSDHYDSKSVWGKKLSRKVVSTEWSKQHHLAGRDIVEVTLPELLYCGWQNQGLRYLSQGWFTGAVLTRNVRESVFVEKALKHIRQKGIDLDAAAKTMAQSNGKAVSSQLNNANKANLLDELAQSLISPLQTNREVSQEMADLRRQLEEAQQLLGQKMHSPKDTSTTGSPAKQGTRKQPSASQHPPLPASSANTSSTQVPTDLSQLLAHEPTPDQKILSKFPINGATSQAVNKWLQSLPIKKKDRDLLTENFKTINVELKKMDEDQKATLPDVAVEYGLTVRLAGQMNNATIMRLLLTAVKLLE